MLSTLARDARDVGFDSCSRHNIPYVHRSHDTGSMTMVLYKLCAVLLLNLSCVCICNVTACLNVIVSIKRLTSVVFCAEL